MPRSKTVVPGRARRRKVLKAAKGNFSGRRKLYKTALQTIQRAGQFAYEHRRLKKPDFRRLWIMRINAGARPTAGLDGRYPRALGRERGALTLALAELPQLAIEQRKTRGRALNLAKRLLSDLEAAKRKALAADAQSRVASLADVTVPGMR